MSQIEVVSIEVHNHQKSVPQWAHAVSACVVQMQELTRCVPTSQQCFSGRIEFGTLGDMVLAKLAVTPNRFSRSPRAATPTPPPPVLLVLQIGGGSRVEQHSRSCTLFPGDWCLFDALRESADVSIASRNESLVLRLDRPCDPELLRLLEEGLARRWHGNTGMSRVLQATLTEAFHQFNRLEPSSGRALQRAVTEMVWDALREQLEASSSVSYQEMQRARIKGYIESQLDDPDLSVDSIAQACGLSVRSLHRAFEADPAGSVSNHIWLRRLSHCAASLRDPRQADRSITEICFSWGFNSTSHFSRFFKDQFGAPPSEYRGTSMKDAGDRNWSRSSLVVRKRTSV